MRVGLALLVAAACARADIVRFVSTTGDDSNDGTTPATAWASPGRALAFITFMKHGDNGTLPDNVQILLESGTYCLPESLTFDANSAGDGAHTVTIAPASGVRGDVVLSGGAVLPASQWQPVAGCPDCFSIGLPQATFPQAFVRQLFARPMDNSSSTTTSSTNVSTWQRRLLSSTPVRQWQNVSYSARNATVLLPAYALNASAAAMQHAYIRLYHTWTSSVSWVTGYSNPNLPLLQGAPPSSSAAPITVNTTWTSNDDFGSNQRYAIENIADSSQLDPGTFFFDPDARLLTYRLLPGESLATTQLLVPTMPEVITSTGTPDAPVYGVQLINVSVLHAGAWLEEDCMIDGCSYQGVADGHMAAIHLHGAVGWNIAGVEVAHTGQYGIFVEDACANISISGSWLHGLGAGGVRVGEPTSGQLPDPRQLTRNVSVTDTVIEDGGLLCEGGIGILWTTATLGNLSHNAIHHLKYTGVSVGWTWTYDATDVADITVAFNHIHDIGLNTLSDMGGIYAVGPQPGSVYSGNLVHDIEPGGNGAHALYIDQSCSNTLWSGNVGYRARTAVVNLNYGQDNVLVNNILAYPTDAGWSPMPPPGRTSLPDNSSNNSPVWPCSYGPDCVMTVFHSEKQNSTGQSGYASLLFDRNIFLLGGVTITPAANISLFDTASPVGLDNMTFTNNTYWSDVLSDPATQLQFGPTQARSTWTAWQGSGRDTGGLIANPLFADPAAGNFTLLPGSPVLTTGFQPIDLSTVGPRPGLSYFG